MMEEWKEVVVSNSPVQPRVLIMFWTLNEAVDSHWDAMDFNKRHECFTSMRKWMDMLKVNFRIGFVISGSSVSWRVDER